MDPRAQPDKAQAGTDIQNKQHRALLQHEVDKKDLGTNHWLCHYSDLKRKTRQSIEQLKA